MSQSQGPKACYIFESDSPPVQISADKIQVVKNQKKYTINLKNPYIATTVENVVVPYAFNIMEDIQMTKDSNVEETKNKKRVIQSSNDIERAVKRQVTIALRKTPASASPALPIGGHIHHGVSAKTLALEHNEIRKMLYRKARQDLSEVIKKSRLERERLRGLRAQARALNPMAAPFVQARKEHFRLQAAIEGLKAMGAPGFSFSPSTAPLQGSYVGSAPTDHNPYAILPIRREELDGQVQANVRANAINSERSASAKSATLNPSAAPFYPSSPALEQLEDFDTRSSGASVSDEVHRTNSTAQKSDYQAQHGSAFSVPGLGTFTMSIPIRSKAKPVATTEQNCTPSMDTPQTDTSVRHQIPGIPARPSSPCPSLRTPPTPTLGSSPRFIDQDAHRKAAKERSARPPLPVAKPKKKRGMIKERNPFIDVRIEDGDASPYEYNPYFPGYDDVFEGEEEKTDVGPYRKAAMWEFTGLTFEKGGRVTKRKKSRSTSYAPGFTNLHGPSSLSLEVLTEEEERKIFALNAIRNWDDTEAARDWEMVISGFATK